MGMAQSPAEELAKLNPEELQHRYQALETQYNARHKKL